jgi:hypothetical protein
MAEPELAPVIRDVIEQCKDKKRLSDGITACTTRMGDFTSEAEMQLAGIAMVPEARQLMTDALTQHWDATGNTVMTSRLAGREVIIGGGLHAAIYAASRTAMGFPRPVVLERGDASGIGGAFAMSMQPAFWLNSRSRPGPPGLPDQDKALNAIPGALLQPSMISSQEYISNADMAWLIRLALAQSTDVARGVTVTGLATNGGQVQLITSKGTIRCARVLDARGLGDPRFTGTSDRILNFPQFMARMGTMFPLRGMQQVAIIGGGNSGLCAAESLLGIAPGHASPIGLDYVSRADIYAPELNGQTCETFRAGQRGRYVRLAQMLDGNVSNPSARLRVVGSQGYPALVPGGVLVNDRTYDMAIMCTGYALPALRGTDFRNYGPVRATDLGTTLATRADNEVECYRIGPAASIPFSDGERAAGIAAEPASQVAMFRLAPRTAALAATLPALAS